MRQVGPPPCISFFPTINCMIGLSQNDKVHLQYRLRNEFKQTPSSISPDPVCNRNFITIETCV